MTREFELEEWLPMSPMEGPPLPRFFNILWPWYKGGFTLRLTNVPPKLALWNANFAEKAFEYKPLADSGWLEPDEVWEYPSDPLGCTTLRVWALDADNHILFDVKNLGPVENGKDYAFDCLTKTLSKV